MHLGSQAAPENPQVPKSVIYYWIHCQLQPLIAANRTGSHFPYVKPSYDHSLPVFLALYLLLAFCCLVTNTLFLYRANYKGIQHNFVFKYLALLSVSNLISGTVGVSVTLIINVTFWEYGGFLCHVVPVVQEFLMYVTFLCLVFVVAECYRETVKRAEAALHFPGSALTIYTVSLCLALPNLFFTNFYSMNNLEFCQAGSDSMEEYAR